MGRSSRERAEPPSWSPRTRASTTELHPLTVLEPGSQTARCQQGRAPSSGSGESPHSAGQCSPFELLSCCSLSPISASVLLPCVSLRGQQSPERGPTLVHCDSIIANDICKGAFSKIRSRAHFGSTNTKNLNDTEKISMAPAQG